MKRLLKKSWLIPVMTMVLVIGMSLTAMAEEPTFPEISEHEPDCQHTGVLHMYATGKVYFQGETKCVECCIYKIDGQTKKCYEGSPEGSMIPTSFLGGEKPSKGWYYSSGGKYIPCKVHGEDEEGEEEDVSALIDHDTFKSEAPSKTVIASDTLGAKQFFDLKVHAADERTKANQELLAKYYVGANAKVLLTENIYPNRDLSTTENGSLQTLTWNNLPKNQAGPVYAVVYNQTDKAYVINGTLDANGTAGFAGFKLRPASTITICK